MSKERARRSGRRTGRQTGSLARRRRTQTSLLLALLAAVNVLVWFIGTDWATSLAALVVSVLVAPVLHLLLFARRP
jgi:membrane protein YdbS with pleckstrin-like domain